MAEKIQNLVPSIVPAPIFCEAISISWMISAVKGGIECVQIFEVKIKIIGEKIK